MPNGNSACSAPAKSDVAFPEGNVGLIVVQIKQTRDGETVTEKLNRNLMQCPNKEHACNCDHAH